MCFSISNNLDVKYWILIYKINLFSSKVQLKRFHSKGPGIWKGSKNTRQARNPKSTNYYSSTAIFGFEWFIPPATSPLLQGTSEAQSSQNILNTKDRGWKGLKLRLASWRQNEFVCSCYCWDNTSCVLEKQPGTAKACSSGTRFSLPKPSM